MSVRRKKEAVRKALYELIWQTAHLYKDAPGGKLACPQRPQLERYVEGKIMTLDFMLDKVNDEPGIRHVLEAFFNDLEAHFQASVHENTKRLTFYENTKRHCLRGLSKPIGQKRS